MEQMSLISKEKGERIDKFLGENLGDLSRSYIQKLLKDGLILVNGKKVKANYKLNEGDQIDVEVPDPEPLDIAAENIPLDILYEDEDILIVNNYRDYEQDKAARKRTTIVLFGRTFGLVTYLLNGILAFLITLPLLMDASPWLVCLFAAFSVLFAATWLEMKQYQGRELNRTLGHTARNVFIYAVLLSVVLLFGS